VDETDMSACIHQLTDGHNSAGVKEDSNFLTVL